MTTMSDLNHDQQTGPRRFRIRVAGRLGAGFAEGIDPGFEQHDSADVTTLTGELVDQSQIYGILDRLQRLGIEVLRFDTYAPESDEPPPADCSHPEHDEHDHETSAPSDEAGPSQTTEIEGTT